MTLTSIRKKNSKPSAKPSRPPSARPWARVRIQRPNRAISDPVDKEDKTWRVSTTLDAHLQSIAESLADVPGGLDVVYEIARGRYPGEILPYKELGLHDRAGNTAYDWRMFLDLNEAEWSYLTFDPVAAEQVPFDQMTCRYRKVTPGATLVARDDRGPCRTGRVTACSDS